MARSRILALAGTVVLLAAGVAVVVPALFGGHDHRLRAVFDEAVQIAPGQEVRVAGRKVGHVGSVEAVDGNAIVDLDISEGDVWPLRRGTTAAIRWGSTTSLAYRYIELDPGRAPAPDLPDGGALSRAHTITPVELDQAYRIFRGRTRGDLKTLVGELGDTLDGQGGALRRGLRAGPGGLDATSALLRELGDDQDALRTLMVSGDRVTSALSAHSAQLGDLVTHAAGTFDEFARHTRAEQAALSAAPRAFAAGTSTLKRFDGSLVGLRALVDDLAPGAKRLRTLATPARQALTELHSVVPLATSAFRSGRRAAPA